MDSASIYWSATAGSSSRKRIEEREGTRKERLTTSTPIARV